jgi:hypothetical protein
MKTLKILSWFAALAILPSAHAQKGTLAFPHQPPPNPPPADYVVQPPPPPISTMQSPPKQVFVYDQKALAGGPTLVTPDQARNIISRFKAAYPGLGSPRFLIYVNRELVNQQPAMKLVHRSENIESARKDNPAGSSADSTVKSTESNEYRADDKAQPTLADQQTVRDVERLFGRPLRDAGASLVDQKVAAALIADKPLDEFIGTTDTPEARKDREAIGKIADAVIEVLISSKTVTVPTISGTQDIAIPDIQATAIGLKDSKILGQASSSDVTGHVPPSTLGNFSVNEITEATALALMEDMTPNQ